MKDRQSPGTVVLRQPLTWIAVIEIVVLEIGFWVWFRPPWFIHLGIIGLGGLLLAIWPFFFLRSAAFREMYAGMPIKAKRHELESLLADCTEPFRKRAQEGLMLLDRIQAEFQSHIFDSELERIVQNLYELSSYHAQLYARTQQFGTAEQKSTMQKLLQQQVLSVENSLTALKAFSGNLTLLETHPEDYEKMGNELKAINQELLHVIQEV